MAETIGEWYAEKAKERKIVAEKLREAEESGADYQTILKLKKQLEQVSNLGD